MFRVLTSSLTIVALLAHVLLGCCWHHRHEHEHSDQPAVCESHGHADHSAEDAHSHLHACDADSGCHDHHSMVFVDAESGAHHDTCMGVACSYLAAKVLKIQRLDSQDFLSSVVGPSALPSASASAWSTGAIAPSLQSCPPGLRCALLQTWQV